MALASCDKLVQTAGINLPHSGGDYHMYDVPPDSQRFLISQFVGQAAIGGVGPAFGPDPPVGLIAALNWWQALRK